MISTVVAAPAIAVFLHAMHSSASNSWIASIATGFGAAAVIASAFAAATSEGEAREVAIRRLAAVITMPAFVVTAGIFLQESAGWHPLTLDGVLASVDRSFGVDPSAVAGILALRSSVLWWTCKLVYDSLPMVLCAVVAARWLRFGASDRDNILIATVVAGAAAQLISQVVPACGPRFLWGSAFPMSAAHLSPSVDPSSISPAEFRNAFPSLHMTGALFIAWSGRPFGQLVRSLTWAYVAVTVVATMGSGEHYLVDLVVAAPFALAIRLAVRREQVRRIVLLLALVAVSDCTRSDVRGASDSGPHHYRKPRRPFHPCDRRALWAGGPYVVRPSPRSRFRRCSRRRLGATQRQGAFRQALIVAVLLVAMMPLLRATPTRWWMAPRSPARRSSSLPARPRAARCVDGAAGVGIAIAYHVSS